MTHTDVGQRVRQIDPAASNRAISTLGRVDYEDAFVVDIDDPPALDAEGWIRAMLEGASTADRLRLLSGWSALGLKVNPRWPQSVLGWPIRSADADVVLLGADSRVGMPGELMMRREQHGLVFATFVRHDNPVVAAVWAVAVPAHVRMVRGLLEKVRA